MIHTCLDALLAVLAFDAYGKGRRGNEGIVQHWLSGACAGASLLSSGYGTEDDSVFRARVLRT